MNLTAPSFLTTALFLVTMLNEVFSFAPASHHQSHLAGPVISAQRQMLSSGALFTKTTFSLASLSKCQSALILSSNNGNIDGTREGKGLSWVKRSANIKGLPDEILGKDEPVYLDAGIEGETFGNGKLSEQMYGALMTVAAKKFPSLADMPEELQNLYLLYAMDATAKETVKALLDSNGFVMDLGDDINMEDEGNWGAVENVVLNTPGTDGATSYGSFADAIARGGWRPGQNYSFIVREVPTRVKNIDLAEFLKSLDPEGKLREEAKENGILMPDDDIESLRDLSTDCVQRVNSAPVQTVDEAKVFRGGDDKGYNVISRSSLRKDNRNLDGSENHKTLLHVMDALANHGCLIVDLSDGDELPNAVSSMSKMWETTSNFFEKIVNDEKFAKNLPEMRTADGVGSSHAVAGYASFKSGQNEFLETRIRRADEALLPEETETILGETGAKIMVEAFNTMTEVGKDIVRIVVAASSVEAKSFLTSGSVISQNEGSPSIAGLTLEEVSVSGILEDDDEAPTSKGDVSRAFVLASEAASLLAEEILDDGKPLPKGSIENNEGPVSMSPHRLCRYSNNEDRVKGSVTEIFGAHTDTTFVTIVPAASISGLEVFDEDAFEWYRPELYAKKHSKGLDRKNLGAEIQYPWHCRYLIVMPGELLQIVSRNNVPAVVHRVVASSTVSRLSAPILLRARNGTKMDVERYMGSLEKADSLLREVHGMKMEEIHDALQTSSQ